MLAYLYGLVTIYFEVFPYRVVRDATLAVESWSEILAEGDRPANLEFIDENGDPRPQILSYEDFHNDDGHILMTGGPYALMSECPEFGCLAWIINRRGEVLHSWEVDLGTLWADTPNHTGLMDHEKIMAAGLHLSADGELTVSFQTRSTFPYGVGIAKFDKDAYLARAEF